jgi:RpiR family carbohydrate utilization transcriptional regulator
MDCNGAKKHCRSDEALMLLESISNQLGALSKSEKKVALTVIKNPEQVVAENITALARNAGVSEPTVVRFCRTLGCEGWHEFKLKLAQGLALALPKANEQPGQDDLAADLVNKICSRSINTLLDLRNNLKPDAIAKALDVLAAASKIEFYGQGTSGIVAMDAQHKFFRSGVPTVAYADPHIHNISASLLKKGDVVVAISQRGNSTAILRSAQLARKAGADVIALTPAGTPLADAATLLVPIDLGFDTDPYTPISARLAHLVVIDILAVGLALKRGPEFRKKMQSAQKSLQKFDVQFDSFLRNTSKT